MATVYTSATCPDLIEHRRQANLILRRMGHDDASHSFYLNQAGQDDAARAARIRASQLYAGIFAWSYGPGPMGRDAPPHSFTEMEYEEAMSAGLPCLIFLLGEAALWRPDMIDDNRARINAFRARLAGRHRPLYFETLEEFTSLFHEATLSWSVANGHAPGTPAAAPQTLQKHGWGLSPGGIYSPPGLAPAPQARAAAPAAPGPSVFVSYAAEDEPRAREFHRRLKESGLRPWLDKEELLPGENWEGELRRAMRESDFIALCLSRTSVWKTGFIQKEFRWALEVALERPPGSIFLFPVRLDDCPVPDELTRYHSVDLYSADGFEKILRAVRKELGRRGEGPAGG